MPEYIPQWTPPEADPFLAGYLDCAEWLLDDEAVRASVMGWAPSAVDEAADDCRAFASANAGDLESVGADDYRAGMDFWLSRCGHGAGFFDRGTEPEWRRLQDAAEVWGSRDAYVGDDGLLYFA